MSTGTLKTLVTRNERAKSEEWTVVLKKLLKAVVAGVQPFRMTGKGLPGRGSGPRLTDREHYKQDGEILAGSAPFRRDREGAGCVSGGRSC